MYFTISQSTNNLTDKTQYDNISNIYCDASAPVVWQSLKQMLGERWNESYMKSVIDNCKQFHVPLDKRMVVVPVNFSTEHRKLLQNMKWALNIQTAKVNHLSVFTHDTRN